ncbi:MAG: acylneuraminate cytidylyltransferase family protein [Lachnospiraceae bacterium]|nr:acylneuraminate cytidylyltransferase family protein [Lachnospiraceae bacterium]
MYAALIPVRGGSKSIPLKNVKEFCGKPLVYWTVKAANECKKIDKVYVSTDSKVIRETVKGFGFEKVEVIGRSGKNATDTASTESVMAEFAYNYQFDNLILIQATSPLLMREDLEKGIELFEQPGVDSVLSSVRQKRFCWKERDGYSHPVNYDFNHRPRRQEFDGYLVENGAFYIISKPLFLATNCRLAGNIKTVEMSEDTYYEIDEPSDWIIMEELMKRRQKKLSQNKIPPIKLF